MCNAVHAQCKRIQACILLNKYYKQLPVVQTHLLLQKNFKAGVEIQICVCLSFDARPVLYVIYKKKKSPLSSSQWEAQGIKIIIYF